MKECMKRIMALILTVSILAATEICTFGEPVDNLKFSDVKATSWYYSYVTKLMELKITAGIGNNMFGPNLSVTRAEFVTFLCNVKGYEQMQGNPFADSQKSWASGYITAALANGIIDLPADQKFNPNYAITRQEAAEMVCRALNIAPDDTSDSIYADVSNDAGYSAAAYYNYIMRGSIENNKFYFKPDDKLTRAETAAIIVNAYDYNIDKLDYLNKKISEEKEKKDEAETKARRHQEWLAGMDKGVSKELLSCTDLLGDYSLEEQHFRLMDDLEIGGEWPEWNEKSGLAGGALADGLVSIGRRVVELWINADYRKTDIIKNDWAGVMIEGYDVDSKIKKIKDNTWVREGYFYTGKSLLTYDSVDQPTLRGTIRYRWINPSQNTGENKVGVWYEEDIKLSFYPQYSGMKANGFWYQLTKTRTEK